MKVIFGFLCRNADISADRLYVHAMEIGIGGYILAQGLNAIPMTSLVVKFSHDENEIGKEIEYQVTFCDPDDTMIVAFPPFKITPPKVNTGLHDESTSTVVTGFSMLPMTKEGTYHFKVVCDGVEVHRQPLGISLQKPQEGAKI